MNVLQRNWTEPAGWALIVAGLGLAVWTLGEKRRPRLLTALAGPSRRAGARHAHRIDAASQWQRLVDIVEDGAARTASLVALHARAMEEVEAAHAQLAECTAALTFTGAANSPQGHGASKPELVARPLAA